MDFALVWFIADRRSCGPASSCSRGSTSGSACCTGWSAVTTPSGGWRSAPIGPVWDGNEVWLIVAGAAMFAAFPGWYATMFSGFYLALLLLLVALIVRGVSFEYRGQRDSTRWRRSWDRRCSPPAACSRRC